jgi:tetratricopeptide (TPR) repeat protein
MWEEHLITGNDEPLKRMIDLMHGNIENYHELALDYANAYLYDEAEQILRIPANASPLTHYYIGSFLWRQAKEKEALESFSKAENACSDYCFPNRLEDIIALEDAKLLNPEGARAPYYLGCLYYDKRQYDIAQENWELASQLDPSFPTVWRNLALIYCNKQNNAEKALECMERAFSLDQSDSRIFMELDQLYKRMQKSHEFRLAKFESHPELVAKRDDLILEHATLLNQTGEYERAAEIIDNHIFHPWEGGEGKVPAQYQFSRTERAKAILRSNSASTKEAIGLLSECLEYPHNLGEGKLHGAQENDFHYFLGCAYEQLGDYEKAREYWELATVGPQEPAAAMYYNDAKPEKIFYQGMALLKLGRTDEANGRFYRLVNYGKQHIFEKQTMDYFAVSLPDLLIWEDSLDRKNRIHCLFMLALGYTGLGDKAHAERYLSEVEQLDINHQGVQALRTFIQES